MTSRSIMWTTVIALVPGLLVQTGVFGLGVIVHIVVCAVASIVFEALVVRVSGRAVQGSAFDGSAIITGLLIGAAVPAGSAWWVGVAGVVFGLGAAKHLYGGLGQNPFNPAMAGYAFALVCWPLEMSRWFDPSGFAPLGLVGSFDVSAAAVDGLTGATPLDANRGERIPHFDLGEGTGHAAGRGGSQSLVASSAMPLVLFAPALAYAAGGLWLLYRGVMPWRAPLAMLLTIAVCAGLAHALSPERYLPAWVHLGAGATMIAAFFVVTDPVTAPVSRQAQWIAAVLVGVGTFSIRTWGVYPDGVAFAVLAVNMLTPLLDRMLLENEVPRPGPQPDTKTDLKPNLKPNPKPNFKTGTGLGESQTGQGRGVEVRRRSEFDGETK